MHSPNGNGVHALPVVTHLSATQRDAQRLAMVSQINAVTKQLNTLTAAYRSLAEDHGALISELGRRIDLLGREQDAAKAAHAGFYGAGLWARVAWLVRGGR